MKWVKFFFIIQAVLVIIFTLIFLFQTTLDYNKDLGGDSSLEKGYLPSMETSPEVDKFVIIAGVLIVISVLELIILICFD
jgi:hypothetical protein